MPNRSTWSRQEEISVLTPAIETAGDSKQSALFKAILANLTGSRVAGSSTSHPQGPTSSRGPGVSGPAAGDGPGGQAAESSHGAPDAAQGGKPPSAMCIVGHIRTLPFVFGSLERFSLLNALDVYMVLQKGFQQGSTWLVHGSAYLGDQVENKVIERLQEQVGNKNAQSMKVAMLAVAQDGGCAEYSQKFRIHQRELPHTDCKGHASNSQIRWQRTCFEMVLQSKIQYDRVVRTRPDVSIFQDIVLDNYPRGFLHAPVKKDASPVAGDWFYFLDYRDLKSWWGRVEQESLGYTQQEPYPDYYLFKGCQLQRHHFPVVIVRSTSLAECCRLGDDVAGRQLQRACEGALLRGAFSKTAAIFGLPTLVNRSRERGFCNLEKEPGG